MFKLRIDSKSSHVFFRCVSVTVSFLSVAGVSSPATRPDAEECWLIESHSLSAKSVCLCVCVCVWGGGGVGEGGDDERHHAEAYIEGRFCLQSKTSPDSVDSRTFEFRIPSQTHYP